MVRRLLQLLLAIALLALGLTVGYAALRLHGPEETLAEAEMLVGQQQFAAAVTTLELCEVSPAVQQDPALRQRLLRLRYTAQARLGNTPGALEDLERLLAEPGLPPDDGLLLDRVRLLAVAGDGAKALQRAREFLQQKPGHGRALELAGEACQTLYRDDLAKLGAAIERDVGQTRTAAARRWFLAYLYRPDGDPEVEQGLASLRTLYTSEARLQPSWPPLGQALGELRRQVQEGLDFFQQSLAAGGQPVAAFRGLALALAQADRLDDLLLLCESYRRRFDHRYVAEAGAAAAFALLLEGLDAAAAATIARFLDLRGWPAALRAGKLGNEVHDLLLAAALVHWQRRDAAGLQALRDAAVAMQQNGLWLPVAPALAAGWSACLANDGQTAEAKLAAAMAVLRREPPPVGRPDLLAKVAEARLQLVRQFAGKEAHAQQFLSEWAAARPAEPRPWLWLAELQLERGKAAAALATLDQAARVAPDEPSLLPRRLEVARRLGAESGQDGPALLAQCLKRRAVAPETSSPLGLLLCAETALQQGIAPVAVGSALAAVDKFPAARLPRELAAQALLLAKRPQEAVAMLDHLLQLLPPDAGTVALALRARTAAQVPLGPVLGTALRTTAPLPELLTALLREALRGDAAAAAPFAAAALRVAEPSAELRLLAAQAEARRGNAAAAAAWLAPLQAEAATLPVVWHGDLGTAVTAWLQALSRSTGDAEVAALAQGATATFALARPGCAPALLAGAAALAPTHPRSAAMLLGIGLPAAAAADRTGQAYLLAGRLAAAGGDLAAAEPHYLAALAFADGREAAEPLARLWLAQGRTDRALQAYRLIPQPRSPWLALRAGDRERGSVLLQQRRDADPADLLGVVGLLAAATEPLPDLPLPNEADRQAVLELLDALEVPELAALALPRATALASAHPGNALATWLLARAELQTGQAEAAARRHDALFAAGTPSPLAWREFALAAATHGYPAPAIRLAALQQAVAADPAVAAAEPAAWLAMTAAIAAVAQSYPQLAADYRVQLWLRFPARAQPTTAELADLAARGRRREAFWAGSAGLVRLPAAEQAARLRQLCDWVAPLLKEPGPEAEGLFAQLRHLLDHAGPHGPLLHLVLDHGAAFPGLQLPPEAVLEWLRRHLQHAAAGHDGDVDAPLANADPLARTLQRLQRELGQAGTLAELDAVLALHPAALRLWWCRAELLAQHGDRAAALADLRRILAHAAAPHLQLAALELAARAAGTLPADLAAIDALPKDLAASPAARRTRALVALRLGDPTAALAQLQGAAPAEDGMHLFAAALAVLQTPVADAVAAARLALAELVRDYPSSAVALKAGSFARQLAPR